MNDHKTLDIQFNHCDHKFKDESDLSHHMKTQHESNSWHCDLCDVKFSCKVDLEHHWHLAMRKNSGTVNIVVFKPSQIIQDTKSMIISCFTCKIEFTSYWNLMNHRKQKHPSNRTCRYFFKNACFHVVNCWYRHDEPMETDARASQSFPPARSELKCDLCDKSFDNSNSLITSLKPSTFFNILNILLHS